MIHAVLHEAEDTVDVAVEGAVAGARQRSAIESA
jgi:hypothetical protein